MAEHQVVLGLVRGRLEQQFELAAEGVDQSAHSAQRHAARLGPIMATATISAAHKRSLESWRTGVPRETEWRERMGFSDRLKELGDKAKNAAADNKDRISGAVESAGAIADQRTRGKYSDKIAKATEKTGALVDRLAPSQDTQAGEPGQPGGSGSTQA
jgi:hypothetical protein